MTGDAPRGDAPMGEAVPESVPEARAEPGLRPFPMRVLETFFNPGALTEALARDPAWVAAVVAGVGLVAAQMLLIPADVWDAMMRETLLRQGREMPAAFTMGGTIMRVSALASGVIGYFLVTFVFAGIVTVVFAFVMGDEGRFRQYLAMVGHAWLIPGLVGLVLLPLKIFQQDPRLTLNLGSFLFFLPEGYLKRAATMLDLSQGWAWLVVAQGAHAIHPQRSFRSAAAAAMVLFVLMAALFALIPGAG